MAREMKESGVEWAKEIPEHWNLSRIKFVIETRKGGAWGDEPKNTNVSCICLRIADFDYNKLKFSIKNENEYTYRGYRARTIKQLELKQGDLLIEKSGGGEKTPVGRVVLFDNSFKALFANFMDKLSVKKDIIVPKFLTYWFSSFYQSRINTLYIKQTIGIQNLDLTSMLAKEKVFYPSVNEQKNIAYYLDKKCSEIDSLTADIKKQISFLEDYKKSIITESVTKGLNPNVELKDSGVEWIGDIPKHWTVHPIYCYFSERKNKNFSMKEHNLLSLSYGKIIKKDINALGGLLPASFNTYNIVERDDIIIRPTDLQNDKKSLRTGLVQEKGIITSAYLDLKPNKNVCSKFFHYLLHSYDVIKVFYNMGNGVRQGLTYGVFSSLKVIEPPLSEQQNIANYLDKKCSEIDSLISEKKEQLEKLASYKQSMIYEYVTGKKEVPTQEIA